MNIELHLNESNKQLLSDLRTDFNISFEEKEIDYCEVYSIRNESIIYYNPKLFNNASIAHELLHIKLRRYKYLNNHIYHSCQNHSKLKLIFTKFLCDFIGNCFDHLKMYPEYLELGYSPNEFIRNATEEKCSTKKIKSLKLKFLWAYKANSVNIYIGYLISIYADHLDNQYEEHLSLLKSKDPKLFEIITSLWDSWSKFDITNIDSIHNSDLDLFESFIYKMEQWIKHKIVIHN